MSNLRILNTIINYICLLCIVFGISLIIVGSVCYSKHIWIADIRACQETLVVGIIIIIITIVFMVIRFIFSEIRRIYRNLIHTVNNPIMV